MPKRPSLEHSLRWPLALLFFATLGVIRAETVILFLKNGDRIAGTVVSEDTNRVVITTTWVKELAVPLAQIARREKAPQETPAPKPAPPPPAAQGAVTNIVPSAKAGTTAPVVVAPQPKPKPKHWKGELKVGADFLLGAVDRENYYGRFKLVYELPYPTNPKQFFRDIFDYGVDYGKTGGVLSANRMDASDKADFDIGREKWFAYNSVGAGYDEIRRIDLHYEGGPGIGYHVFSLSNFVANAESGLNYQAQYRSDNTTSERVFYRLAEDVTWKLNKQFTFTEKFEFFPEVDLSEYRARFESTVSYGIWQHVSLNLTVVDLYDTQPAQSVPNNDLQIRSSLGFTF